MMYSKNMKKQKAPKKVLAGGDQTAVAMGDPSGWTPEMISRVGQNEYKRRLNQEQLDKAHRP